MSSTADKKQASPEGGPQNEPAGDARRETVSPDVQQAHQQAEADIENDPETSAHSPNDDLDEGELARLGEDNNPVE